MCITHTHKACTNTTSKVALIYIHVPMHTVIKLKALAVSGGLGGVGSSRVVKDIAHWQRNGQSPLGEAGHGDWRSGNNWLVSGAQARKALNTNYGAQPAETGDILGNCKQRLRIDDLSPHLAWSLNKSDI